VNNLVSTLDALLIFDTRFFPHKRLLSLGGIVADVMGMGKTLTMLSAVVYSKNAAIEFAKTGNCRTRERQTRATLIVATSRRKPNLILFSNIKFHPFS
jgi:hypothetical protein